MHPFDPDRIVLGRHANFSPSYDPDQLCPIARDIGRSAARIPDGVRCYGEDIWNIYELSWLTPSGRPEVAMAEVRVPSDSPCLIESKSLKLYCNSFNMSCFADAAAVARAMTQDLSRASGAPVRVELIAPERFAAVHVREPNGRCLDEVDTSGFVYEIEPEFLVTENQDCREGLFSRLFRSRCPVTGQPDWATVYVRYAGSRILPGGLLRYLVSFREHQGFHEACVERIHADIIQRCRPRELHVSARFTRRGGIDINPVRSTRPGPWDNIRDPRQ